MSNAAVGLEPGLVSSDATRAARTSTAFEFWITGGASLVLLPACWLLARGLGLDDAELAVGFVTFYAAHVINDPHFAVTYLLFYRDVRARTSSTEYSRAQRLRYVAAGFVAPLALVLWAGSALASGSAASLGLMTQLMFALVDWHYVKQGFGVVSVLSLKRGTRYGARERYALLTHAFAGWAYAWASPFDPGRLVEEKGVIYRTLAHPRWLESVTGVAFLVSAVVLALVLFLKWRREGRVPPLGPLVGFLASVWLWTAFSGLDPVFLYLIPALHSLQYLYFVWLMKRNQARESEGPPRFGRPVSVVVGSLAAGAVLLGLVLFHLLPSTLDGALVDAKRARFSDLGVTPYFAALFTFVNLHHYFMDAVLWRRDNPETSYLRA